MTHRPLEKVQKSSKLMWSTVVINVSIFICFILLQWHYETDPSMKIGKYNIMIINFQIEYDQSSFKKWTMAANVTFLITMVLYMLCTCLEPGFVKAEYDMVVSLILPIK